MALTNLRSNLRAVVLQDKNGVASAIRPAQYLGIFHDVQVVLGGRVRLRPSPHDPCHFSVVNPSYHHMQQAQFHSCADVYALYLVFHLI